MYLIHNTTVLLLSVLYKTIPLTMPEANVPFCELIYAKTSKVVDIFLNKRLKSIKKFI